MSAELTALVLHFSEGQMQLHHQCSMSQLQGPGQELLVIYVTGAASSNKIWMAPSTCVGEKSGIEEIFFPAYTDLKLEG